jgi:hypothetical protein
LNELNPVFKSDTFLLLNDAKKAGLLVAPFETLRTKSRQIYLRQSGTSRLGIGWHCFRLAVDIWPILPNKKWPNPKQFNEWPGWKKLAELGKKRGFRCGSTWGDFPHFEKSFGMKLLTLSQIYTDKDLAGVDEYVKAWINSR